MKNLGKKIEITEYPDAGHQFENETNQQAHRGKDAEDACNKTITFLAGTLKQLHAGESRMGTQFSAG